MNPLHLHLLIGLSNLCPIDVFTLWQHIRSVQALTNNVMFIEIITVILLNCDEFLTTLNMSPGFRWFERLNLGFVTKNENGYYKQIENSSEREALGC